MLEVRKYFSVKWIMGKKNLKEGKILADQTSGMLAANMQTIKRLCFMC